MATEREILEELEAGKGFATQKGKDPDFESTRDLIFLLDHQGKLDGIQPHHESSTGKREIDLVLVRALSSVGRLRLQKIREGTR